MTTNKETLREEFERDLVTTDKEGNKVVACPEDMDDGGGISFWRDYKVFNWFISKLSQRDTEMIEKVLEIVGEDLQYKHIECKEGKCEICDSCFYRQTISNERQRIREAITTLSSNNPRL